MSKCIYAAFSPVMTFQILFNLLTYYVWPGSHLSKRGKWSKLRHMIQAVEITGPLDSYTCGQSLQWSNFLDLTLREMYTFYLHRNHMEFLALKTLQSRIYFSIRMSHIRVDKKQRLSIHSGSRTVINSRCLFHFTVNYSGMGYAHTKIKLGC